MNKDTKILLMAVVIILVALVSFNFNDITGRIISNSEVTTLAVSPTKIDFGPNDIAKMITIRVSPGFNGINKKIMMHRVETGGYDSQITSETANICTDSLCYDDVTISYRIDSGLKDGKYYFKAERENMGKVFVSNEFEITHI